MDSQPFLPTKKFWSIQNITKQHTKKVAPMKHPNEQKQPIIKKVQSERKLTKEEQYKKATIGLRRIMTQFSLAEIYSSNMATLDQDNSLLKSSVSSPILFDTMMGNHNNNNENENIDNRSIVSTIISDYQYQDVKVGENGKENEASTVVDLKLWLSSLSSPIPTSMNTNNQQQQYILNMSELMKKPLPELPMDENEDYSCSIHLEKPSSCFKSSSLNNSQPSDPLFKHLQKLKVNNESIKEKTLHCRVIQITNISSSKEYQYELYIKMDDVTRAMQSGYLKKIEKGISVDNPKGQLSFGIDGPFSLTFTLHAKPTNVALKKMKTILSSMSIHQDMKENMNNNDNNEDQYQDGNKETNSNLPMVGFTQLLSGNRFETFKGKGLHRYTLTKPVSTDEYDDDIYVYKKKKRDDHPLDIEIMIAFYLEERSSLSPISSGLLSSPHLVSSSSSSSMFDSYSFHSQSSFNIFQQGDFLDFYIKDDSSGFNWVRYWVTLEKECIYLRNLQNINIETIECIPLNDLIQVYQPLKSGKKEEEKIFHQPEHGLVLLFKKNDNYPLNIQKKKIGDNSENKYLNKSKYFMYLCAENSKKATLWRTAFNTFISAH
ncbi:unnamed protein product [Cunninghamella blakesleeana]